MLRFDSLNVVVAVTYLAQALVGVILFFVFRHFSLLYRRRFLNTWSWGWIMFSVAMVAFIFLTGGFARRPANYLPGMIMSWIAIAFSYAQIWFLLIGAYELLRKEKFSRQKTLIGLAVIGLISLALVVAFSGEPVYSAERYLIRVGLRYGITSICFAGVGYLLLKRKSSPGIGYKLMSGSMISFGMMQAYYLVIIISFVAGHPLAFPSFFGIVDLILMSGIGMGMLIGLLEDERENLRKTNLELDSFLYSTSHDLRAPIASILGLTNIARMDIQDSRALEMIGMIEGRVKKLDAVIGDILSLARGKKAELKPERISLNRLVDEVVADVKFAQDAPAIRLIFERDPEFFFHSDFAMMKTVLGNLFSNGVKYHRVNQADPFIKVTASKNSSVVTIRIEDNGQGIRPESQEKIFEMFYRATSQSEGTGLGLFIVRESLARLDGQIALKSDFGVGSVFTITLPARG